MEPAHPNDKVRSLQTILARTLRISIQDGRSFVGVFACVDREKNVVLSSTEEYPSPLSNTNDGPRFVGLVMIPWRWVVKAELEMADADLDAGIEEYT